MKIEARNCDVLLLAAGFGKRLLPLTATVPKPLLTVSGRPLIEWNLLLLQNAGFRRVFVNLHHLGEQIKAFVGDGSKWGMHMEFSEEPVILDTGGGIKNIESRLNSEHLVVVNSDTLVGRDFSYKQLLEVHANGARATLFVREDGRAEQFGALRVDSKGRVVGLLDAMAPEASGGSGGRVVMFGGIHVLSRKVIAEMPPAGNAFSVTRDTYRTLVRNGDILRSYEYAGYWNDVGTPERLEAASKDFPRG